MATSASLLLELREKEWLTVREASQLFGFPIATFKDWVRRGMLTEKQGYHHFGRSARINQLEFRQHFMDARLRAKGARGTRAA
jgi:hypothetical protein